MTRISLLGRACDYMTAMGKERELRQHWQRACKLILAKADVLDVSRALELALFMDAKLDVSNVPGGMKTRTHFAHRIEMLDAARRRRSARTYRPSSKKRRLSAAGSREQYRI